MNKDILMTSINQHFSDGVLNERFLRIDERFDEQLQFLGRIESKVSDTNGSIAKVKESVAFYRGAVWMLSAFTVLIVLPILGFALFQVVSIPSAVRAEVELERYQAKP